VPIPELREWTLIRLSYVTRTHVVHPVIATARVRNRPHFSNGSLIITSRLKAAFPLELRIQTQNTLYQLVGPSVATSSWEETRWDWTWQTANYDFQCLTQIEDVEPFPSQFDTLIESGANQEKHWIQRGLLNLIDIASDIDIGAGLVGVTSENESLEVLAKIACRTSRVDDAQYLARQGRQTFAVALGGLTPAEKHPDFPSSLILTKGEARYVPKRLIEISASAHAVSSHLPEKLGSWARCAWMISPNPNMPQFKAPIIFIEAEELDTAIWAAATFPKISPYSP